MRDFTINRSDGFGAQLNAILVGYLVARQHGCQYFYTPLAGFKLLTVGYQNKQLEKINGILDQVASNLGLRDARHSPKAINVLTRPYDFCNEKTFKDDAIRDLKRCWPLESPFYSQHVVIHVRRGGDIDPTMTARWQTTEFVNDIVRRCVKHFPGYKIKVLCWGDPGIDPSLPVTIDTTDDGGDILDHFNQMVHADVLVVANSSFSLTAGLMNKNTVICPPPLLTGKSHHHPKEWDDNWSLLCDR